MASHNRTKGSLSFTSVLKHLSIVLALIVILYPLGWLAVSSLRPTSDIPGSYSLIPDSFRWENYVEGWNALGSVTFGRMLLNSFFVAAASIIGNLLSCSLAAYAFARLEFRFRRTLFAIMLITIMLPYHVQIIPQYVIFLNLGWVNTFLPLIVPKFLATDAFFIFLLVQFIRGLPRQLDEAAVIDGAGPFDIYWRIILPLIMPALAATAVFTFLFTWGDFFTPMIYLTDPTTYTVQLGLRAFLDTQSRSAYGPMFAMAIVAIGPVFGVFLAAQRYLVEGVATTGLK